MHNITIHPVGKNEIGELQEFAHSFDHDIELSPHWPLFEARNGAKKLGYFFTCSPTLIYPSIHPHCTPREVMELCRKVKGDVERSCNGNAGALIPKDSRTFTSRVMRRIGFNLTNLELYVS